VFLIRCSDYFTFFKIFLILHIIIPVIPGEVSVLKITQLQESLNYLSKDIQFTDIKDKESMVFKQKESR